MNLSKDALVFDVDGTICYDNPEDYSKAIPFEWAKLVINTLRSQGWFIIFHTARYYRKCDGDLDRINAMGYNELKEWLDRYGFEYDRIVMGKPSSAWYIDDKGYGISHQPWEWQELYEKFKRE
jgi:capsule biosynthesis phosphatase